jgi:exonuclease SbcC
MKICKVKFKNIHSLKGDHEIDFENGVLAEAGLFVITGATGTGKSSILDVITLALFNRIPRIDSPITESIIEKEGVILTKNAPDCFAEIEYEVKGIKYRSSWSIRRTRTGSLDSRKQDLTNVETNAIIVSGIREVVKKNEEIIGLNFEQFVQSMILAQGQFSKLLLAKKDERNLILEKITGSSVYRRIGVLVFERHKEANNLVITQKTKMGETVLLDEETIDTINADIIEKKPLLEAEIAKHKILNTKKLLKESIQKNKLIKGKNQTDWNVFLEVKKAFATQENLLAVHDDLVGFRTDMNQIESYKSTALALSGTILNLEKEVLSFEDKKKNNIILAANLVGKTILEADFEKELDAFLKQVIAFQDDEKAKHSKSGQELQRLNDKLKELNNFGTSLLKNDELTENIQEKINAISAVINQSGLKTIEEVSSKKTEFANLILPASQLIGNRKLYDSKQEDIETLEKTISTQEKNSTAAIAEEQLLKLKIDGLISKVKTAGIELEDWKNRKSLDQHRSELEVGKPCPLCGSESHPYSEKIEDALINVLQEKWDALSTELTTSEKEYSVLIAKIKGFQEDITLNTAKLATKATDFVGLETTIKTLCSQLNWDSKTPILECEAKFNSFQEKQRELDKLEKEFQALKVLEDLKIINNNYLLLEVAYLKAKDVRVLIYKGNDVNKEVSELKTNFALYNSSIKGLKSQIIGHQENQKNALDSEKNVTELLFPKLDEKGIKTLEELKSKLLDEVTAGQIRKKSLEIRTSETVLKTTIKATDSILEEETKLDDVSISLEELIELLPKLSEAISELQKHIWDQEQKIKVNEENKQRLQKSQETLDALLKDLNLWTKMNLLIGDGQGKKFSNFVQDLTLRQLIEYGNKRLIGFSDRYLSDVENEAGALRVIDTYMGNSKRSVTSLSGGETFKLSLALAFGLSDLAARNVNIESLFIDEGFGSLDPESLDQAITILENMQNESNKSIGIISHVGELKDRIGTKIKLLKTGAGYSTIEIE